MDEIQQMLDVKSLKRKVFNGIDQANLNLTAIYELFKRDDFPGIKIGKRLFVTLPAFNAWLNRQGSFK
jgi:hypothetical protein